MVCYECIPTWYVYKSYYDRATGDSGIYHEQRLPIDLANKIISIHEKKRNEEYLRYQVNKMNVSEEERERIYLELLNG